MKQTPGSFSEYLVNFPLHPPDFPIRDYRAIPVENQDNHIAILKIDVGDKDLQQCADTWMRLYAEYFWLKSVTLRLDLNSQAASSFHGTITGTGFEPKKLKSVLSFYDSGEKDDSYSAFRKYFNIIFRFAGTIFLDKESLPVAGNDDIKPGDFIINSGRPGHSVVIVGVAKNNQGKRIYLLAESYMPAQDVDLLKNTGNPAISPWDELDVDASKTITAKYTFKPTSIKHFHAIK